MRRFSTRDRWTIVIYGAVLAAVIAAAAYQSRAVLFRPWTARGWMSAVREGRTLYLFGGKDELGCLFSDVMAIDLETRRLSRFSAWVRPI